MFGGGSTPAEQSDNAVASQANNESNQSNQWGPRSCETDAKSFTQCLDQNQGNMQICGWYLEQLVSSMSKSLLDDGTDVRHRKLANRLLASTKRPGF